MTLHKVTLYIEDYNDSFDSVKDLVIEMIGNTKEIACPAIISSEKVKITEQNLDELRLSENIEEACDKLFNKN